eukprot:gene20405-27184_t
MSVNMMSKSTMQSTRGARATCRSRQMVSTSRTPLPTSPCVQPSRSRPLAINCQAVAQAEQGTPSTAPTPIREPTPEVQRLWRTADAVFFDVDCTLVKNDGLDVIAEFLGNGEAIEALTSRAMEGTMSLDESLDERLRILDCTPSDIRAFLIAHPPESRINEGAVELIATLQKRGVQVYLISGGFREILNPIAEYLGVPPTHVIANRMNFQWDPATGDATKLVGFDPNEPTSRNKGKPLAIRRLREAHPELKNIVMVGDGVTDLEAVLEEGGADVFIGYVAASVAGIFAEYCLVPPFVSVLSVSRYSPRPAALQAAASSSVQVLSGDPLRRPTSVRPNQAQATQESGGAAPQVEGKAKRLLYLDGLNYLTDYFFPLKMRWWDVPQRMLDRVGSLVEAAGNNGWTLVVFLDATLPVTTEAQKKWRKRRAIEVTKQHRNGVTQLLGEAFQRHGVQVRYSFAADNDDTLAYWAHKHGAATFYGAEGGRNLRLVKGSQTKGKTSQRSIDMNPPPETWDRNPSFFDLKESAKPHYIRGGTSALVRRVGVNHHVTVRPLRQALYARMGLAADAKVLEEFPVWESSAGIKTSESVSVASTSDTKGDAMDVEGSSDKSEGSTSDMEGSDILSTSGSIKAAGGKVVWLKEYVSPDPALDHLLDDPKKAVEVLFPGLADQTRPSDVSECEWDNHVFSCHALAYEICCAQGEQSFLTLLLSARSEQQLAAPEPRAGGGEWHASHVLKCTTHSFGFGAASSVFRTHFARRTVPPPSLPRRLQLSDARTLEFSSACSASQPAEATKYLIAFSSDPSHFCQCLHRYAHLSSHDQHEPASYVVHGHACEASLSPKRPHPSMVQFKPDEGRGPEDKMRELNAILQDNSLFEATPLLSKEKSAINRVQSGIQFKSGIFAGKSKRKQKQEEEKARKEKEDAEQPGADLIFIPQAVLEAISVMSAELNAAQADIERNYFMGPVLEAISAMSAKLNAAQVDIERIYLNGPNGTQSHLGNVLEAISAMSAELNAAQADIERNYFMGPGGELIKRDEPLKEGEDSVEKARKAAVEKSQKEEIVIQRKSAFKKHEAELTKIRSSWEQDDKDRLKEIRQNIAARKIQKLKFSRLPSFVRQALENAERGGEGGEEVKGAESSDWDSEYDEWEWGTDAKGDRIKVFTKKGEGRRRKGGKGGKKGRRGGIGDDSGSDSDGSGDSAGGRKGRRRKGSGSDGDADDSEEEEWVEDAFGNKVMKSKKGKKGKMSKSNSEVGADGVRGRGKGRQRLKLDADGKPVLGVDGNPMFDSEVSGSVPI